MAGPSELTAKGEVRNRLIALLPAEDRQLVIGDSVRTSFRRAKDLYGGARRIDAIYFPLDCVVSVLAGAGKGAARVEIAMIGNEGAVGVFSILNAEKAMGVHLVQLAGDAMRLDIANFNKYIRESPIFHKLMHRYLYALTHQIVQAGACDRLHRMEERCARWLLMTHDRSNSDALPITQEFLSEMLGVRRATVNFAIGILRTAGFIQYIRGQITITDRTGLESAACPCYELIRREYRELSLG